MLNVGKHSKNNGQLNLEIFYRKINIATSQFQTTELVLKNNTMKEYLKYSNGCMEKMNTTEQA